MLCVHHSPFPLPLEFSVITPWRKQPPSLGLALRTCTLWKQMEGNKDRGRSLVGGGRGWREETLLPESTSVACWVLGITECLNSVSPRGKMIPEELERRIGQARQEVRLRDGREGGGTGICLWGRASWDDPEHQQRSTSRWEKSVRCG